MQKKNALLVHKCWGSLNIQCKALLKHIILAHSNWNEIKYNRMVRASQKSCSPRINKFSRVSGLE